MAVQSCLQALNLGSVAASDFIPRMLDVVGKYTVDVENEFANLSSETPTWVFLRWISQIASIVNRPESRLFKNLVNILARKYP